MIKQTTTPQPLNNQRGQMTIEGILLLVIMVATFTVVQRAFKQGNYLNNMIEGPWVYVQGMVENGVWASTSDGKIKHPNTPARRASPDPT